MKNIAELLAPAGSFDALKAAVQGGCDAVYLGHKSFSARSSAQNFDNEELSEAVRYCHLRGVKVYLAVNTLCLERQFKELESIIKLAADIGIDAVIVQDLGVCRVIKKICPDMKIHASTQMSVHSVEGVEMLYKSGINRVVLSRELSGEEIEYICKNTKCEIEVFVHGAICISYSGKCLFSSLVGGRSGNRGKCGQPCRLPYKFENKRGNLLSPRDMCLIDKTGELSRMGVCSLKIEGRMKSPEYVGVVTSLYRKALDGGEITKEDKSDLRDIFSRGGEFTNTYYTGEKADRLIYEGSNDNAGNTASRELLKKAAEIYGGKEKRFLPVNMFLEEVGGRVSLTVSSGDFYATAGTNCEEIPPLDSERATAALSKTGGTTFKTEKAEVRGDISLRISNLNALRREALCKLENEILNSYKLSCENYIPEPETVKEEKTELLTRVATIEQGEALNGADGVIIPIHLIEKAKNIKNIIAEVPVIITLSQKERVKALIKRAKENGINKFFCQSLDAMEMAKGDGAYIIAGFSVNISNFEAAREAARLGANEVIASCELPLYEAENILNKSGIPVGATVYGRMPLMVMRHCLMKDKKCGICKGEIVDRRGISFPVLKNGEVCGNVIYNSRPLYLADKDYKNRGFKSALLYFTTESAAECRKIFADAIKGAAYGGEFTRGYQSGGKW